MPIYVVCLKCKKTMPPHDIRTCQECRKADPKKAKHGDYMREYWRKRRSDPIIWKRERVRLRKAWLAKPEKERKTYAREVMERWRSHPHNRGKIVERNRRDRLMVFKHYGLSCACCSENTYEFLSIDHINGGGRKHYLSIKMPMYRWLIKNKFPDGFRTLCYNCNFCLGHYGYCPHQNRPNSFA